MVIVYCWRIHACADSNSINRVAVILVTLRNVSNRNIADRTLPQSPHEGLAQHKPMQDSNRF